MSKLLRLLVQSLIFLLLLFVIEKINLNELFRYVSIFFAALIVFNKKWFSK